MLKHIILIDHSVSKTIDLSEWIDGICICNILPISLSLCQTLDVRICHNFIGTSHLLQLMYHLRIHRIFDVIDCTKLVEIVDIKLHRARCHDQNGAFTDTLDIETVILEVETCSNQRRCAKK